MGACCSASKPKDRKLTYSVPKHQRNKRQSLPDPRPKQKNKTQESEASLNLSQEQEKHHQQHIYHDRKKVMQSGAQDQDRQRKVKQIKQQQQDVPQPKMLQNLKAVISALKLKKEDDQKKQQNKVDGDAGGQDDDDDDDDDYQETDYDIVEQQKQDQPDQQKNVLPMQSATFFSSIMPQKDINDQFSKLTVSISGENAQEEQANAYQEVDAPHYLQKLPSIQAYEVLVESNDEFIDKNFPHSDQSILDPERAQNAALYNLQWKKARQVYGDNYALFSDDQSKIAPSNISQGALGDCYILSALSAIAEWPKRIKNLFITHKKNQAGIYAVKLYLNGQLKQIIVDQYFPYNPKSQNFAFCSASRQDPQIWPMLIQKAYAKVFGSYQRIQSGTMMQSLQMLTCSYVDILNHKDTKGSSQKASNLWKTIKQADQKQHIMLTNVHSQNQEVSSKVKQLGLVDNHAYSLIDVHQLEIPGQNRFVRLLNIRNPWGKWEWNGDWSDKSDKWTPQIKKQVNFFEDKDDGQFFISFQDFVYLFHNTTIARYEEDYSYSSKRLKFKRGEFQLLRFEVGQQTDLQLLYYQEVMRFQTGSKDDQFKYDLLNIAVLREEQGGQEYTWLSNQQYSRKNNCTQLQYPNIEPGNYILYLEVEKQITKQLPEQQLFSWLVVKSRNAINNL